MVVENLVEVEITKALGPLSLIPQRPCLKREPGSCPHLPLHGLLGWATNSVIYKFPLCSIITS